MKAYKATYNMKCQSITFEIGKTYTHDGELIFCEKGFHFCKDPRNTLKYYNCTKDFKLMEIDAIGIIYDAYDKSITNKLTVIRVVPKEEYSELLGITLDKNNNVIKKVLKNGDTFLFEYDTNNNMIKQTNSRGDTTLYEYDTNNNRTKLVFQDGTTYLYEYDQNKNLTKKVYPNGDIYLYEYDQNNKCIVKVYSNCCTYLYDDLKNDYIKQE